MLAAGFLAGPVLVISDPEHTFGELLEPMVAIALRSCFKDRLSLNFRELSRTGGAVCPKARRST